MVKHLEQTGELENTIIIFQADNGPMPTSSAWPLRGKKTSYAEGGMRNCFNSNMTFDCHYPKREKPNILIL